MDDESRPLSPAERAYVESARAKAHTLYEGRLIPHRSCGIALAETFGLPSPAYQALRRGGITGEGACGAIRAGEQVLGELLGDPDPAGAVTKQLRNAVSWYQQQVPSRISRGASPDYICNNLTQPLGEFKGAARHSFCTHLAATVAEVAAEALMRFDSQAATRTITPIDGLTPAALPNHEDDST